MNIASLETYHLKKNIEELQAELENLRKKTALLEHETIGLKKQNDNVQFLEQLLTLIPEHIYWKNADSVYLGCNDRFAQMFGLTSRDQVIGKSEFELNDGANAAQTIAHDKAVIEYNQASFIEESALNNQGRQRFFLSHKVPVEDRSGHVIGLMGISFDITERKKIEEELKIAQEKAEAANDLKTEIIRNFSHDIRTPLAGIIGMSNILIDRAPQLAEDLNDIKNASEQLLNLLSEIITVSQMELDELPDTQEKFSLQLLVKDTLALFKPAIHEKGLDCTLNFDDNIPHYLLGNISFIQKILMNLVGNAVKFTDVGSIGISVDCLRKENGKLLVQLIVQDTGIGIPEDKQSWIFEPFNRLTPTYQGQYKGSGLGLHIVSEFIRKLGGEIYVKSTPGKGSTFKCLIPLKRSLLEDEQDVKETVQNTAQPLAMTATTAQSMSPLHVLLVEDNFLAQKTAKISLEGWGYQVVVASNGQEALMHSQAKLFDLIYMDLGLPDHDGATVTQLIRQDLENPNYKTPIVALTAHADDSIRTACQKAGMQAVLSKPLTENKASDIATQYLNKKSSTIDLKNGAEAIQGDIAGAKKMLDLLAESLPNDKEQIVSAYTEKNTEALHKLVHKLRGGLCYCGVPQLKAAATALDLALRNQENDADLAAPYTHLIHEIELFLQEWGQIK